MTHAEKMKEIRTRSPFPWTDQIWPNGVIKVFDTNGQEVALFDLIAVALISTATIAAQPQKEAA